MKYLQEEKIIYNHICYFVILFVSVLLLRLTTFRSPPENGIAINFGTTSLGLTLFNRQNPSICFHIAKHKQQQVIRIFH
jgi:hypothetical protein